MRGNVSTVSRHSLLVSASRAGSWGKKNLKFGHSETLEGSRDTAGVDAGMLPAVTGRPTTRMNVSGGSLRDRRPDMHNDWALRVESLEECWKAKAQAAAHNCGPPAPRRRRSRGRASRLEQGNSTQQPEHSCWQRKRCTKSARTLEVHLKGMYPARTPGSEELGREES